MRMTLAALALLAAPAFAANYTLELKPATTTVQWTLGALMHTVHGTFRLAGGRIDFDPETGKASGQVVVDTTSGKSGNDDRDRKMHATVLESTQYPQAVFVPSHIAGPLKVPGTSSVKVAGVLTILGVPHEVTMDVQTAIAADQLHATMTFDIPYVAWNMKDPSSFVLKVGKIVHVAIDTAGSLQKHQ